MLIDEQYFFPVGTIVLFLLIVINRFFKKETKFNIECPMCESTENVVEKLEVSYVKLKCKKCNTRFLHLMRRNRDD